MAKSLVISLIGAAGMAAALLVGCGDSDAKLVASKQGESCARTADCADGLTCIANVCYKSGSTGGGGEAGQTSAPGPVLGGIGESCTSRLDCATGLACFNQRCTDTSPTGEGGAPSMPSAQLGARGETCRVNGDCATDLVCIPSQVSGVGVCDLTSYGYTPSDKICGGECQTATDCCELPLQAQQIAGVKSCEDVTAEIAANAVTCKSALPGSLGARLCAYDAMYCTGCSKATWSCTDNRCVYAAACTVAAGQDSPDGCPTYTRVGSLVPACNATDLTCTGATAAKGCTTDASCKGEVVADSGGLDTCSDGECTCYTASHACYRKCGADIECAPGKVCDTKTKVCIPSDTCATDGQCAADYENIDYKCNKGKCALACKTDHDCSPSGLDTSGFGGGGGFNGYVCGADGFCASIAGCTDDTQCSNGSLKTFCIDKPTGTGVIVSSAITN